MLSKNGSHKNQIIVIFLLLFPVICCLGSYFFLTTVRDWDYQTCIPNAARKIGVEPEIGAIYQWISDKETPGISREAIMSILETLGPITFVDNRTLSDDTTEDTLRINICSHPFNNIILYANYSTDGKLIAITIDDD